MALVRETYDDGSVFEYDNETHVVVFNPNTPPPKYILTPKGKPVNFDT